MPYNIETLDGIKRLSTQELLQKIYSAIEQGETEFFINACGQHNIGGPLWSEKGSLKFTIKNPGQRVGSMCMDGTTIIVEGSASADVGWLNAGGEITVKGDGGDTTAHCAASGNIYIGGRVGTRSGSLMKHDPAYEPPQFWVLKNTGSFSFEFMGGGIAVICGIGCEKIDSVLGDRACVGMVGGVVYFRGKAEGIDTTTTKIKEIDKKDMDFLKSNIPVFLEKIDKKNFEKEILHMSEWKKIIPKTYEEKITEKSLTTIRSFRDEKWVDGGIFGDIYEDNYSIINLVNRGKDRLRVPEWLNAHYASPCEDSCPAGIPSQLRFNLLREGKSEEAYSTILEYSPFPGSVCAAVCPSPCMDACSRCLIDKPINIKGLGHISTHTSVKYPGRKTGKKVAIIGAGVSGLTAAWILRLRGHGVTVFERSGNIGGKLVNAVSRERLDRKILDSEIAKIKAMGIDFRTNSSVNQELLQKIINDFDKVIVAIGAYKPKLPPWPGVEKISPYLDFLKKVNSGKKPDIGKHVVVIGCGNSGMDVVYGAYACGAEKVTAIDIQKPAAFEEEIDHAKQLGAKILWPVYTEEINDKGVKLKDGSILEADTVFAAIGETPELDHLPESLEFTRERGYLKAGSGNRISENIYAAGDVLKLGILADAIGSGRDAAIRIDAELNNKEYAPLPKSRIPQDRLALDYFNAVKTNGFEDLPQEDYNRCISCGTCRDCEMCLKSCPEKAISRHVNKKENKFEYVSDPEQCIGCGICEGICPCGVWTMKDA